VGLELARLPSTDGMLLSRSDVFQPPTVLERLLSSPVKFLLSLLYKFSLSLRLRRSTQNPSTKIVCISDTHAQTSSIPSGDILIHAGDLSNAGTLAEIQAQIDWLSSLPHLHKIAIAGNHDTFLDPRSRRTLSGSDQNGFLNWRNIHYLQHDSVTLTLKDHKITVYGAPQTPTCGGSNFAFQYPRGQDAWSDTIPANVDILVTHTPPKYHLDLFSPSLGCEWLLKETWRVKPRLHVFGHIHADAGMEVVFWDDAQKTYERGMARRCKGFFFEMLNPWLWLDVVKLVIFAAGGLLWDRVWAGEQRTTIMVNASLIDMSDKLENSVQIETI
jgi:predicted phosphohydrolase